MRTLEEKLKKLANPKIAEHSQRFFKTGKGEYGEGDKFLGIRVPRLRELAKEHHDLKLTEVKKLLKSPYHEIRLCGFILLVNQYNKSKEEKVKDKLYKAYVSHFKYLNNWDLIDVTCHKIIGPHLKETKRSELYKWARSKKLWEKRISIISTFHYVREGDLDDSYKLAEILLNDDHDLMHKAVGWVLRDCGKRDFKRLESFILKNYKKMPRTMLRYAIEHFPETKRKKILRMK
ncbi:MAG: DNA alkylation repair protein [Bacteriovoracaceae bacterium]